MSMTDTDADGTDGITQATLSSWTDDRWRSKVDLLVLIAVGAAFWLVAGIPGLSVTVVLGAAWVILPNVAVFVAGVVAVAALVPDAPLELTVPPIVALSGLLLTTTLTGDRLRDSLATLVALALVGAVALAAYSLTGTVWVAVVAVLVASAAGFVSLDLIALSAFSEHR